MTEKEKTKEIEREKKLLLEILLKKNGITYKDLVDYSVKMWVAANVGTLTASERKLFKTIKV